MFGDLGQPLQCEGKVGAATGADHGVDLVDDNGSNRAQHLSAAVRGEEEKQRFRRRHEDVRRRPHGCGAFRLRRVAGADPRRDPRGAQARRFCHPTDGGPRLRKVLVDVGAQRLQRRNVNDSNLIRERCRLALFEQAVDRGQKGGERLTGAGWCGHERVAAGDDRLPRLQLRWRGLPDLSREPPTNDGMECGECHVFDALRAGNANCTTSPVRASTDRAEPGAEAITPFPICGTN